MDIGPFGRNVPEPGADVVGRRDYGLLLQAKYLFWCATHEHVIECRMVRTAPERSFSAGRH